MPSREVRLKDLFQEAPIQPCALCGATEKDFLGSVYYHNERLCHACVENVIATGVALTKERNQQEKQS